MRPTSPVSDWHDSRLFWQDSVFWFILTPQRFPLRVPHCRAYSPEFLPSLGSWTQVLFPQLAETATSVLCSSRLSTLRLLSCTASEFCKCLKGKTGRKLDSIPTLLFLLASRPPHTVGQLKSQSFIPIIRSSGRLFPGIFRPVVPHSSGRCWRKSSCRLSAHLPEPLPFPKVLSPEPCCLGSSLIISAFFS